MRVLHHFAVVILELLPYLKYRMPFSTHPIPNEEVLPYFFIHSIPSLYTQALKGQGQGMRLRVYHASRVGEKLLEQDDKHLTSQHSTQYTSVSLLHFEHNRMARVCSWFKLTLDPLGYIDNSMAI